MLENASDSSALVGRPLPDLRAQFRAAYGLHAGEEVKTDAAASRIAGETRPPDDSHSATHDATALPPHAPSGEEAGP